MNLNISEIINNKLKELDDNGTVKKAIEDAVEKTVISSITDELSSYQTQYEIKKRIASQIGIFATDIDLTSYNGFIVQQVKSIVEDVCREDLCKKIEKTFTNMFICEKESIKLSEIFEKYRKMVCEGVQDEIKYDRQRFHLKYTKSEEYGWLDCELSEEEITGYSRPEIKFFVYRDHENKAMGRVGSVYLEGININENSISAK